MTIDEKSSPDGRPPGPFSNLPDVAEPSGDLWPAIEGRVGADTPYGLSSVSATDRGGRPLWQRSPWLQAAAAVVLFAAGAASGLGIRREASVPPPSTMNEALALAVDVQRTGSEYIAALAAFTAVVDSLSQDVRGQGTSAAFATLYSAADQLAALNARDPNATSVEMDELNRSERRVRF